MTEFKIVEKRLRPAWENRFTVECATYLPSMSREFGYGLEEAVKQREKFWLEKYPERFEDQLERVS